MKPTELTGVPAGSPSLICDGVSLAFSRHGQGQPIVCLHAIGHGGADFAALITALQHQFELICIDWPQQGRSGADKQPASATRYAQLLELALQQLDIKKPIIIGNSIGGAAAILYAAKQPVHALVLCDAGGLVPINWITRTFVSFFMMFFQAGARGIWGFPTLFRLYYRYMILPSPAAAVQRQLIINSAREIAPVLRDAWYSFKQPEADIRAVAASLDISIWCAWAKQDRVIPLWMCRPAIKQLKHAQLSTFRGGHSAFLEQPEAFVAGLQDFINSLFTEPRGRE